MNKDTKILQLILKDYSIHIHFRFSESGCFWLTCNDCFCDCLSVLEPQPALDLVSE